MVSTARYSQVSLCSLFFPGSVIHVKAFGHAVVVLNDIQALSDLLDKRGQVYSDRPKLVMAGEMMGLGQVRTSFVDFPIFNQNLEHGLVTL